MYISKKQPDLLLDPVEASYEMLQEAIEYIQRNSSTGNLADLGREAIDCSGTGGSGQSKFNYSTACAFVLAASGQKVVKFGNRSNTGNSGSQDFLEKLGFNKEVSIDKLYEKTDLVFLNARSFYPQLESLAARRKELKRSTILNFIGPLLNPCKPQYRLLGVSNAKMQLQLFKILLDDSSLQKALIVRSENGLDELDPKDRNRIYEIDNGEQNTRIYNLTNIDFMQIEGERIKHDNVETFFSILKGEDKTSEVFKALVLNAAAGLLACRKVSSIEEGVDLAQSLIESGYVYNKFEEYRSAYNAIAQ